MLKTCNLRCALSALFLPSLLWCQHVRGTIPGHVTDPTGTVIPGVTVHVNNASSNALATSATNAHGNYTLPLLLPGGYSITVRATGFKKLVHLDVALEVGGVAETVTVTAKMARLETATVRPTVNASPAVGSVDEFKLQTNRFQASYGPAAGAIINVTVRSGANDLHGITYGNDWRLRAVARFANRILVHGPPTGATRGSNVESAILHTHTAKLGGGLVYDPAPWCRGALQRPYIPVYDPSTAHAPSPGDIIPGGNNNPTTQQVDRPANYSSNRGSSQPCVPRMPLWHTFLWGSFGSAAALLLKILKELESPPVPRVEYRALWLWLVRVLLTLVAGGLAVAYEAPTPLLAIHVGVSTPLIIVLLAPKN